MRAELNYFQGPAHKGRRMCEPGGRAEQDYFIISFGCCWQNFNYATRR